MAPNEHLYHKYLRLRKKRYKGLLLVSEIRKNIRGAKPGEVISEMVAKEFDSIKKWLEEETQFVLPFLSLDNSIRKTVEAQYAALYNLMSNFDLDTRQLPQIFADLLEENIRFEFKMLFPLVENQIIAAKDFDAISPVKNIDHADNVSGGCKTQFYEDIYDH